MGVMCQIFLHGTREGVYRAGQVVGGFIKYAVDEPTDCKDIVISLIGRGDVHWTEKTFDNESSYWGKEEYVSQHVSILRKESKDAVTIEYGSYEHPFQFNLPENIPSSFRSVDGNIGYYVQIKFERPGLFVTNKVFKKEVIVYGNVEPIAAEAPTVYGLQKKLLKPLSSKQHLVNVRVDLDTFFICPGVNIEPNISVTNDTDLDISVRIELHQQIILKASCGRTNNNYKVFRESTVTSDSVHNNSEAKFTMRIPVPPNLYTLQHSKIIERNYALKVIARLPFPHINECVIIPIAIGEKVDSNVVCTEMPAEDPPSYWEAMDEDKWEKK